MVGAGHARCGERNRGRSLWSAQPVALFVVSATGPAAGRPFVINLLLTELADGAETSEGRADSETGEARLGDGGLR